MFSFLYHVQADDFVELCYKISSPGSQDYLIYHVSDENNIAKGYFVNKKESFFRRLSDAIDFIVSLTPISEYSLCKIIKIESPSGKETSCCTLASWNALLDISTKYILIS